MSNSTGELCVAFKAHMGWVNVVAVRREAGLPAAVAVQRSDFDPAGGRVLLEPWHVAAGWQGLTRVPPAQDPAGTVAQGLKLQQAAMGKVLDQLIERWAQFGPIGRAVVLTGRGRLGALETVLASHAQVHIAEGESIRSATRHALEHQQIPWVDQDEKDALGEAAGRLGRSEEETERLLRDARPTGTRRWSKEERLLAAGAWLHG